MVRYLKVLLVITICLLDGGSVRSAAAGANPSFTLPMHVAYGTFSDCSGYLPVDCLANRPVVNISGNVDVSVFLAVANYQNINGVNAAIQWSPSWSWVFGIFDCLPGQRLEFQPNGTAASGATVFDCVNGPALAVFAMIFFQAGGSGCVQFIQPEGDPLGIFVQDCQGEIDQIMATDSPRLGRVCVGAGGVDACDAASPVESKTWGAIKAAF